MKRANNTDTQKIAIKNTKYKKTWMITAGSNFQKSAETEQSSK
jgi:hypothetical protein